MVNKNQILKRLQDKLNREIRIIRGKPNKYRIQENKYYQKFCDSLNNSKQNINGYPVILKKDYGRWKIELTDGFYKKLKLKSNNEDNKINNEIKELENKVENIRDKIVFEGINDEILKEIKELFNNG